MKKNVISVTMTAILAAASLAACNGSPFQVMDGDGMINENPAPDPTKPATDPGDTLIETGTENNPVENEKPDDEAVYAAFINNECTAEFDHDINDEKASYTFDEMIDAEAKSFMSVMYSEDALKDLVYTSNNSYALIDCGMDGVKELAVKMDCTVTNPDNYDTIFSSFFVLKNYDDTLKCISCEESFYRSWCDINEYGVIKGGGSGGATMYVEEYSFLDADGETIYDYTMTVHRGLVEPMVPISEISTEKVTDSIYLEDYSGENDTYTAYIYNFNEYPSYPENLEYDDKGKLTPESADRYALYDKEMNEFRDKNIITFEDMNGNFAEPTGKVKDYLDKYEISYYDGSQVEEMIFEHEAEIGLNPDVKNGKAPAWISLNGQGTSYAFEGTEYEASYIGEFIDDLKDPNLQIAKGSDGKYIVQIGIGRLCFMPDGVGELYDDRMEFVINDENGNPMEGYIKVDGEAATVTFTYSNWEYISAGDEFKYIKNSSEPNLFIPQN